jgi:hypothetical protein
VPLSPPRLHHDRNQLPLQSGIIANPTPYLEHIDMAALLGHRPNAALRRKEKRRCFLSEQKVPNRLEKHVEPMLGMGCSRLQLQQQKTDLKHLPCVSLRECFVDTQKTGLRWRKSYQALLINKRSRTFGTLAA